MNIKKKKKAIVVGGSNGIGLAIVKELIKRNYYVFILDITEPDNSISEYCTLFSYMPCNLLDFDKEIFEQLASDENVKCLMITAGFGRVADFEFLHTAEIEHLFQINAVAGIEIIRIFYEKIKSNTPFFCGMMGSIAGLINSPMFSVYAASKAAICRFIESVNIELEVAGVNNRILNVSPGSIKGTKFNGATQNDVDIIQPLAEAIVDNLMDSKTLFIPEYDKVYKDVLKRCYEDNHKFGLSSYQYKKQSGRAFNEQKVLIGYLSGTFDLFHVGHLNLLRRAKGKCDYLIVGIHPDASHKGKETFIPFEERMQIVGAVKYVDKVVPACKEDSDAWNLWHYNRLFVGSDYKGTERFNRYEAFFADKNVEIVYFPYTTGTSSTQIRKTVLMKTKDILE